MAWVSSDDKVKMIDEIVCNTIEYAEESIDYYKGVMDCIAVIAEYGENNDESTQ